MKPGRFLFHGIFLGGFAFLLAGLPRLRVNTDFLQLLPGSDPEVTRYLAEGRAHGFHAYFLAAVPLRGSRFDREAFVFAQGLGRRLAAVPGVKAAHWFGQESARGDSLLALMRAGDDLVLSARLDPPPGSTFDAEDSLRIYFATEAEAHPDRHRWLLPADTSLQLYALEIAAASNLDSLSDRVIDSLYPLLDGLAGHPLIAGAPRLAGPGVIGHAVNKSALAKGAFIFLATYAALFLILALLLRSFRRIALALGVLLAAVLATHGAMGWLGLDLNMLTLTVASLVLILGIEDTVHITRHLADTGGTRLGEVLKPCALVSVTTAAGFVSLLFSDLPALRGFGAATTLGVALEFLLTAYAYRALGPRLFGARAGASADREAAARREDGESRVGAFLLLQGPLMRRLRWPLLAFLLVFAAGALRLKVDNDFAAYYPPQHRSYLDMEWAERNLYHPLRVDLVLKPRGGDFTRADNLLAAADAERRLREGPAPWRDVISPLSGYAKAELKAGLRDLGTESPMRALKDSLTFSVGLDFRLTSREMERWFQGLDTLEFPGLTHRLSGLSLLMSHVVNALVRNQAANDVGSMLIIFSVLAFLPRRARLAFPAVLANVIPIVLLFSAMGWMGIALDMTTATVASITAGIIVDNTIHLFWTIRQAERGGPEAARSLVQSLGAITSSSTVLAGGFLVLAFSSLRSFHLFGALLAAGVTLSWACNVILFTPFLREKAEVTRT